MSIREIREIVVVVVVSAFPATVAESVVADDFR